MSISFSSANGGLFAANPLRTDRISIKGVNWFGAEGQNAAPDGLWERSAAEYLDVRSSRLRRGVCLERNHVLAAADRGQAAGTRRELPSGSLDAETGEARHRLGCGRPEGALFNCRVVRTGRPSNRGRPR